MPRKKKSEMVETSITEKEYLEVESVKPGEIDVVVHDKPVDKTPPPKKKTKVVEENIEYKVYDDEEIVIFRNHRDHLKWGKYGYISKQGYVALGTYQEYKAGKKF
jgi:hypothetical protein